MKYYDKGQFLTCQRNLEMGDLKNHEGKPANTVRVSPALLLHPPFQATPGFTTLVFDCQFLSCYHSHYQS